MVPIKIWERYFYAQTLKSFLLFLLGFYGVYVLIDYSSHSSSFHHNHVRFQWTEVALYYTFEFVKRVEVLVPFALLIATVKSLCSLNQNNELVALMACGISLKRLLRPFILLGLFFTLLLYFNTEFILPFGMKALKNIDDKHSNQKQKNSKVSPVQYLLLEDQSTIIFQNYDTARELFFDAYWIRSIDDMYRIKYLFPYNETPTGHFVDHFVRNHKGELAQKESFSLKSFPQMRFNNTTLWETITPPDHLALSLLWNKLPNFSGEINEKEAQTLSAFYYKLAIPWLCFLAVIGPAPWCVRFGRHQPVFFIYACSIFGLVACYLVMDSVLILGERQVTSPAIAIGVPMGLFLSLFGWKFFKQL
jgi:lipopolysaccharide export system permease protein